MESDDFGETDDVVLNKVMELREEIEDHRLLNVERYRLYEEEGRKLVAAGDEISIRESSIRRGLT